MVSIVSIKSILFLVAFIALAITLVNAEAAKVTSASKKIEKRGITEWRFKRLNGKAAEQTLADLYEITLDIKPKEELLSHDGDNFHSMRFRLVPVSALKAAC